MAESISNLMVSLTVDDSLTRLNKSAVKFIENASDLLTVINFRNPNEVIKYVQEFLKSQHMPTRKNLNLETLFSQDGPSQIYSNKMRDEFDADLRDAFAKCKFQFLLEQCYKTAYSVILAELNSNSMLDCSQKLILDILGRLLRALRVFMTSLHTKTDVILFNLELFLGQVLKLYCNFDACEFKQKCVRQYFLKEILLTHKICYKLHNVVYFGVSSQLEIIAKDTKRNQKLSVTHTEMFQAFVAILMEYLAHPGRTAKVTDANEEDLNRIWESLDSMRNLIPEYMQTPVENVQYLLKKFSFV